MLKLCCQISRRGIILLFFLFQPFFLCNYFGVLVTPVGLFELQVKISANRCKKWRLVLLKLKSIDKKLKKRAQARRCQPTGCLQIPNQLWLPVEHFIMMEGNPTQVNHSSSRFFSPVCMLELVCEVGKLGWWPNKHS